MSKRELLSMTISPLGTITARFGEVSSIHPNGHKGIDIACPLNEPITAPDSGIVENIVSQPDGLGNGLFIRTDDGYKMIFGHLSEPSKLQVGEYIQAGDVIGLCGDTGRSFGSHLHFGIKDADEKFIDPIQWFNGLSNKSATTDAYLHFDHPSGSVLELFADILQGIFMA